MAVMNRASHLQSTRASNLQLQPTGSNPTKGYLNRSPFKPEQKRRRQKETNNQQEENKKRKKEETNKQQANGTTVLPDRIPTDCHLRSREAAGPGFAGSGWVRPRVSRHRTEGNSPAAGGLRPAGSGTGCTMMAGGLQQKERGGF